MIFVLNVKFQIIHNSKIFYKYKCNTCKDVFIGKTKYYSLFRQYEQQGKSIFTEKQLKYKKMLLQHNKKNRYCYTYLEFEDSKFVSEVTINLH